MQTQQGNLDGEPVRAMDSRELLTGAEAVAAWLASGESLAAYCQRTGCSEWSLRRWRREHADQFGLEIKRRPGHKDRVQPESRAAATMIPIQVVGGGSPMTGSLTIEVRLPRQRSIVIPVEIEGPTLSRLVTAVEGAA